MVKSPGEGGDLVLSLHHPWLHALCRCGCGGWHTTAPTSVLQAGLARGSFDLEATKNMIKQSHSGLRSPRDNINVRSELTSSWRTSRVAKELSIHLDPSL